MVLQTEAALEKIPVWRSPTHKGLFTKCSANLGTENRQDLDRNNTSSGSLTRPSWAATACWWRRRRRAPRSARCWAAPGCPWSPGCSGSLSAGPTCWPCTSSTPSGWAGWSGCRQTAPERTTKCKWWKIPSVCLGWCAFVNAKLPRGLFGWEDYEYIQL